MINVLLVEDDSAIVKVIKDFFERREDFAIEIAENGIIGEELFYERTYDLVLLDIMMPKKDGFELCRDIRKSSIINDIIEKYSDETDRRNIHISVKESDNILTVKGDSFWISEALSNLIDNAIKYSPDSSEINIELREKQISIRNKMSDPDINEKELEKLKKSFMRGDNSRSGQSGNGLGLTIAENILTRNHLSLNLKKDGDDFIASVI